MHSAASSSGDVIASPAACTRPSAFRYAVTVNSAVLSLRQRFVMARTCSIAGCAFFTSKFSALLAGVASYWVEATPSPPTARGHTRPRAASTDALLGVPITELRLADEHVLRFALRRDLEVDLHVAAERIEALVALLDAQRSTSLPRDLNAPFIASSGRPPTSDA